MSKIEELIKEKCPNGVEYKRLKSVCTEVIVPMRDRPKIFDGEIPWCRIEDIEGKYFNDSLSGLKVSEEVIKEMNLKVFPTGTVICSCSASIGVYAINTQPLITNQTFIGLVCGDEIFNKFLLYYMETQTKTLLKLATTGTIPYISRNKFEDLEIPVPPIEVQKEIVRILDKFTELEAGLQAELEARKRQFSYVADKLLSLENSEAPQVSIKEICYDVFSGKNKERLEDGKYPVYGSTGIISSTNTAVYNKRQILIARVGANAGYVHIAHGQYDVSDNTLIADVKDGISLMYIYYQMVYMNLHKYAKGGGQPLVTAGQIKNLTIPLPSLYEQERIVSILQKFDTICNDEHYGIPAEIATRHRQYEFYRDSLLTFDRIGEKT